MQLYELVEDAENKGLSEKELKIEIENITADLSQVREGSLFVAVKGHHHNGHDFIPQAVKMGAKAVICQEKPCEISENCVYIAVENSRKALAYAAKEFYGRACEKLCIIGITGTNGKTTTAHMIAHILTESGVKCGVIGTVGTVFQDSFLPSSHTTPDPVTLHQIFSKMAESGITHVVMEVSSHALAQDRVYGVNFKVGVFTNLSVDHLDYHGDMQNYAKSKLKLFEQAEICIANKDSDFSEPFVNFKSGENGVLTFSAHADSDYKAENISVTSNGNGFNIVKSNSFTPIKIKQKISGFFNVYNALAAFAAVDSLGLDSSEISAGLAGFSSVKGRMETVETGRDFSVIIDFAHTPDGLGNLLSSVRSFCKGEVLVVFGCGGDRDKSKRPMMGRIAEALADKIFLTSDNPRNENPQEIIDDILRGMKNSSKTRVFVDRREAICTALETAKKNDVVVLAGKGHETYQIINGEKKHFDEREEIENFLKNR